MADMTKDIGIVEFRDGIWGFIRRWKTSETVVVHGDAIAGPDTIRLNIDIPQKIFLRQGVEHMLELMKEQGKITFFDILNSNTIIRDYLLEDAYIKGNRLIMRCNFI